MTDDEADAASAKRWADETGAHWHGAASSDATADRQAAADDAAAKKAESERLAHEDRVQRWEKATHRKWTPRDRSGD